LNLAHALERTAEKTPDAVAVVFEGASTTYAAVRHQAVRASVSLNDLGVKPGDRVAIWMANHPSFISALYGIWRVGAVAVPVHSALTQPEAAHIFQDAGTSVVFIGHDQLDDAAPWLEDLGMHALLTPRDAPKSAPPPDQNYPAPPIVEADDTDLALIQYTAGTSGVPKGAMLTHGNLRANIEQMSGVEIAVRADDVALCVLPLFHIFGLNVVLNVAIDVGAKLVLFERFDARTSIDAIREQKVTVVAAAPPAYILWLGVDGASSGDFSSVRAAVSGAAPLAKETLTAFKERFGVEIWEGYGLTETAPALTTTAVGGVAKPGSVGRPLPGVEIRLLDEQGEDVDEDDPGEIVVRGPNVFGGYWNRPDETKVAFTSDGWFRTGDVGVFDDDGDLFIVDRRRDMVIVSGFNVYPREVEDVIRKHPDVVDVAVVGERDEATGERVHAFVVGNVSEQDVLEFSRRSLAPYKLPSVVELVSVIPRNAAGKVLRRELRK
jgi:long-chain acyl-CoA synthetase